MRSDKDPQDLDTERAVLGAMVTDHEKAEWGMGELSDEDFYLRLIVTCFAPCASLPRAVR